MKHDTKILFQVLDVEGHLWDVRQIRGAKHGFELLFGSPSPAQGYDNGGPPRLIVTGPLIDYWQANRTKRGGAYDLPAGRTTLKRVRHRFGFNSRNDMTTFWQDRIGDLDAMSPREFAARHDVAVDVACCARFKLLGRRARKLNWWRKARPLRILRSDITLREKGEKLNISISQAFRLSGRARMEP